MKPEQIMALKLSELDVSLIQRNKLVERIVEARTPSFEFGFGEQRRKTCQEFADQYTVKDVIDLINSRVFQAREVGGDPYIPADDSPFAKKLVELGLTKLDWIVLPHATVTVAMLRNLGKDKMRDLSILLLGTLSSTALRVLEREVSKVVLAITIQDLLATSVSKWGWTGYKIDQSLANTRQKLLEIGFDYDDGAFLQDGTKRQLAENLMAKDGLNRQDAYKVAQIAAKRGWVKPFVE